MPLLKEEPISLLLRKLSPDWKPTKLETWFLNNTEFHTLSTTTGTHSHTIPNSSRRKAGTCFKPQPHTTLRNLLSGSLSTWTRKTNWSSVLMQINWNKLSSSADKWKNQSLETELSSPEHTWQANNLLRFTWVMSMKNKPRNSSPRSMFWERKLQVWWDTTPETVCNLTNMSSVSMENRENSLHLSQTVKPPNVLICNSS